MKSYRSRYLTRKKSAYLYQKIRHPYHKVRRRRRSDIYDRRKEEDEKIVSCSPRSSSSRYYYYYSRSYIQHAGIAVCQYQLTKRLHRNRLSVERTQHRERRCCVLIVSDSRGPSFLPSRNLEKFSKSVRFSKHLKLLSYRRNM